jgi:predicted site-specific integrase-resolvase
MATDPRSIDDVVADLVSLPEAARRLGVDPETARLWAVKGTFPGGAAQKQGRKWVVSVRRLDRYFHGEKGAA